jgi:glutathione peroxidase
MTSCGLLAGCVLVLMIVGVGCEGDRSAAGDAKESAEPSAAPAAASPEEPPAAEAAPPAEQAAPPLLAFTMDDLEGKPFRLADLEGKVLLIVNVASKCGHTPQYKGLQALHETYGERGLVVLGVPSNDFGNQEPGTALEIRQFCTQTYGVTFPMLAKVHVKGPEQTPLYAALTSEEHSPADPGPVKWNFEKFLIGRDGRLAARFRSGVKPESPQMTEAIEAALSRQP